MEYQNDPDREWVGHSELGAAQAHGGGERWRASSGAKSDGERRGGSSGMGAQMAVDEEGGEIEWASGNNYFE
jgi:hypothetical protein